jgi:hypothetical protein
MTPAKQRALVTLLIGLGIIFVGIFGLRTAYAIREFRQHRLPPPHFETGEPVTDVDLIRDWMTIPFIGRTYRVPPPIIFQALGIPKNKVNEEKSLKELNEEYFPNTPGVVLQQVKATIQTNLPPPTALSPATANSPVTAVPPPSP